MDFFSDATPLAIAGVIMLIGGALVTYLSGKITTKMQGKYANLIVKFCGLGAAIAGFIIIMFIV